MFKESRYESSESEAKNDNVLDFVDDLDRFIFLNLLVFLKHNKLFALHLIFLFLNLRERL